MGTDAPAHDLDPHNRTNSLRSVVALRLLQVPAVA
jgi:hypothetical protein